jgi:hypothetical protein
VKAFAKLPICSLVPSSGLLSQQLRFHERGQPANSSLQWKLIVSPSFFSAVFNVHTKMGASEGKLVASAASQFSGSFALTFREDSRRTSHSKSRGSELLIYFSDGWYDISV